MAQTIAAIETTNDFKKYVDSVHVIPGYRRPIGFGIARVKTSELDPTRTIMARYPVTNWNENFGSAAAMLAAAGLADPISGFIDDRVGGNEVVVPVDRQFAANLMAIFAPYAEEAAGDKHLNVQLAKALSQPQMGRHRDLLRNLNLVMLFGDAKPESVESAYLKLYALSTRKAKPNTLVTDGIFGVLPNVAWDGSQPIELDALHGSYIEDQLFDTRPNIEMQDKFPRLLDHVNMPNTVRILDSGKVRLGAYLGDGTTVMPGASYINFNAGTLGSAMVEGRISQGVTVGDKTDVGGGASIIGTLSGGGTIKIKMGERCLLGANSTTGMSLGDACIVDAGVTVLPGMPVFVPAKEMPALARINPELESRFSEHRKLEAPAILKAGEFMRADGSGSDGVHFRNVGGILTAKRSTKEVKLNETLHR